MCELPKAKTVMGRARGAKSSPWRFSGATHSVQRDASCHYATTREIIEVSIEWLPVRVCMRLTLLIGFLFREGQIPLT